MLLDHRHNGIRIFEVTSGNNGHVFWAVPALVEAQHLAGWNPLYNVLLAYGQTLCVLSGSHNQPWRVLSRLQTEI